MLEKHFCVGCFIYDKKKESFLLVHHKKQDKWMQPGGHIEINEDPEQAILREVYEETGLRIKIIGERIPRKSDYILPLAIQKDIISDNHIHIVFIYLGILEFSNQKITPNRTEVFDARWFSIEEIRDNKIHTFKDVIEWCKYIHENY